MKRVNNTPPKDLPRETCRGEEQKHPNRPMESAAKFERPIGPNNIGLAFLIFTSLLLLALFYYPVEFDVTARDYVEVLDQTNLHKGTVVSARKLFEGKLSGPESLVQWRGKWITGVEDGRILLLDPKDESIEDLCACSGDNKCGRPLGMQLVNETILLVADAFTGVYQFDLETRQQKYLLPAEVTLQGIRTVFYDDVAYSSDGVLYASHVSDTMGLDQLAGIVLSGDHTGRIAFYDFHDGSSGFLDVPRMHFPNGVSISRNGDSLLVDENLNYRILRIPLLGRGHVDKENIEFYTMPAPVDNIRKGSRNYWVATPTREDPTAFMSFSRILGNRFYRSVIAKLLKIGLMREEHITKPYGGFLEIDDSGKVVAMYEDQSGLAFNHVSEVSEIDRQTLVICSYDPHVDHLVELKIQR